MAIDYMGLLRQLVQERDTWVRKRDEVERELSRLSELIRSTIKMLPEERRLQCDYDELLERIDDRPRGLTFLIRSAFTAGKEWLTPVEIRDYLKSAGVNFENYKANPLASIHTTLKRMVPHEIECRMVDGQKAYRLKTAGQWMSSFAEARQWMNGVVTSRAGEEMFALAVSPGRPPAVLPLGKRGLEKHDQTRDQNVRTDRKRKNKNRKGD
jgi:hypothetical protein